MRQLATALFFTALSTASALAQSAPVAPSIGATGGNACGAASHIYFVGFPLNEALKHGYFDDALIRRPGEAFATVYIPEQLNLEVDETDVIQRVFCG